MGDELTAQSGREIFKSIPATIDDTCQTTTGNLDQLSQDNYVKS